MDHMTDKVLQRELVTMDLLLAALMAELAGQVRAAVGAQLRLIRGCYCGVDG
jgi:hypothetical protein